MDIAKLPLPKYQAALKEVQQIYVLEDPDFWQVQEATKAKLVKTLHRWDSPSTSLKKMPLVECKPRSTSQNNDHHEQLLNEPKC